MTRPTDEGRTAGTEPTAGLGGIASDPLWLIFIAGALIGKHLARLWSSNCCCCCSRVHHECATPQHLTAVRTVPESAHRRSRLNDLLAQLSPLVAAFRLDALGTHL